MTEYKGAIGIDLGTTRTCVGVMQNGVVTIIPNDQGNRTTPSYVAFTDTEILIGDSAKNQLSLNAPNTVFDAKRLIGRNFSDPQIQQDAKHSPFKVIDREGRPYIQVEFKGKQETFSPEEISSMILAKMKEYAESCLGQKVKKAVITVPAYFNDSQRQATKEACTLAGLEVLRIINEPTAAAVAYGLNTEGERNIVIFDLGGGTFDVSMLYIEDCVIEIKATAGDTHLGGEDFDNRMVEYFRHEFKRKYKKDLADNPTALRRLRAACERAKITLSTADKASVQIESLMDNIDFASPITREKFEQMNADLFSSCLEHIEKVLADSNLDKDQIDDVVLVGGSTRIPMIQEMLKDFFNGKELLKRINPDEVVAYGAASQADVLTRPQDFFIACTLYRSLCQEEIDDMLRKAEETMKIDAKSRLESYLYHVRNAFDGPTVGGNLSAEDKGHLKTAVDDAILWLDNRPYASKEEYERRQKDLESTVTPIISKIYQDGEVPDFFSPSSEQTSQPKFEEWDID